VRCTSCNGNLDVAAVLCEAETCTTCEVRSIKADISKVDEWSVFTKALVAAVRLDGTIHQSDVRPAIRGRIEPKHVGQLYRRARSLRLIRDTGQVEPSSDVAGRNADKLSRIYEWTAA
jgi:hypothetical protein